MERRHYEIELDGSYWRIVTSFPDSIDPENVDQVVGYLTAYYESKGREVGNIRTIA